MLKRPTARAETGWIASLGGFTGASWFEPTGTRFSAAAVLIVSGIAHEERTMAEGLTVLAQSLASAGHGTLLIDLHGTAQSSGNLDAPLIGEHWRDDVRASLRHLHEAGFAQVIVVGVRLGALLAFDALRHEQVAGFVAWSPVLSGRRYVRELRMMQSATSNAATSKDETLSIAGHSIPRSALAHLATLAFGENAHGKQLPMLLLDGAERIEATWAGQFAKPGLPIDRAVSTQVDRWLFQPDLMPAPPLTDIRTITAWCQRLHPSALPLVERAPPRPYLLQEIVLTSDDGRRVRERAVRIEPEGLSAIFSEPADRPARGVSRLLATLVGPGRMFPEFARSEAGRGKACMRFDFAGFSTSRLRDDDSGGSLYGLGNRVDVIAALAWLKRAGHSKVAMVGFCAGAWSMIHAGAAQGVVAVVGINVALYRQPDYAWREYLLHAGHLVSKVLSLLRRLARLASAVDRLERWSPLALNPNRWLVRLCKSPARLLLVYGASDHGLAYLKRHFGPPLDATQCNGSLQTLTYDNLGHLTQGTEARARALGNIAVFLDELDELGALDGQPATPVNERSDREHPLSLLGHRKNARSC